MQSTRFFKQLNSIWVNQVLFRIVFQTERLIITLKFNIIKHNTGTGSQLLSRDAIFAIDKLVLYKL